MPILTREIPASTGSKESFKASPKVLLRVPFIGGISQCDGCAGLPGADGVNVSCSLPAFPQGCLMPHPRQVQLHHSSKGPCCTSESLGVEVVSQCLGGGMKKATARDHLLSLCHMSVSVCSLSANASY